MGWIIVVAGGGGALGRALGRAFGRALGRTGATRTTGTTFTFRSDVVADRAAVQPILAHDFNSEEGTGSDVHRGVFVVASNVLVN